MSLLFQHPALLGLLALAGLPVLVHLLSRARPPVYRFSNIDFLRRVLRRTARIRRPQDWLLLLLRTLALLAIAAAFASPFLISKSASLPGEKSTVILLVDRSASMAAREGVGSRFDAACAQADAIPRGLQTRLRQPHLDRCRTRRGFPGTRTEHRVI